MQELNIETRQQYHKHGVMHRALNSLKNRRCIKAIKLIISMVHNVKCKVMCCLQIRTKVETSK